MFIAHSAGVRDAKAINTLLQGEDKKIWDCNNLVQLNMLFFADCVVPPRSHRWHLEKQGQAKGPSSCHRSFKLPTTKYGLNLGPKYKWPVRERNGNGFHLYVTSTKFAQCDKKLSLNPRGTLSCLNMNQPCDTVLSPWGFYRRAAIRVFGHVGLSVCLLRVRVSSVSWGQKEERYRQHPLWNCADQA